MLKTFPCPANHVSVQPPLSHIRMGAAALMISSGTASSSTRPSCTQRQPKTHCAGRRKRGRPPVSGIIGPVDCVIVSHTHWDREWYRSFQEFRARLVDTVDVVLDLLDSDPGWCFVLDGQTIVIEDYLAIRPPG